MHLKNMRNQIDAIDTQLTALFCERMNIVRDVAEYKRQNNLPVLHTDREQQILSRVSTLAGNEYAQSARRLFTLIMDLSKTQQTAQLTGAASFDWFAAMPADLPQCPLVACQGVDGAYSSLATRRMFPTGTVQFYPSFADVFDCVSRGKCTLGVLPIENSTAGSVNGVYDLMRQHNFYIVRSFKLEVCHCLLAKPLARLEDITDIYSHEQAINQCSEFLSAHPHIHVHLYSNTAAAASFVAQQQTANAAAIAAQGCADIYNLQVLNSNIKNAQHNYTRFIAISRDPVITKDANKISIALTLPHEPGALYKLITQFAALGLNLTKLESRPLPDTDFEFLFYFDFTGSAQNEQILKLMAQLEQQCSYFAFLGNYSELL